MRRDATDYGTRGLREHPFSTRNARFLSESSTQRGKKLGDFVAKDGPCPFDRRLMSDSESLIEILAAKKTWLYACIFVARSIGNLISAPYTLEHTPLHRIFYQSRVASVRFGAAGGNPLGVKSESAFRHGADVFNYYGARIFRGSPSSPSWEFSMSKGPKRRESRRWTRGFTRGYVRF